MQFFNLISSAQKSWWLPQSTVVLCGDGETRKRRGIVRHRQMLQRMAELCHDIRSGSNADLHSIHVHHMSVYRQKEDRDIHRECECRDKSLLFVEKT